MKAKPTADETSTSAEPTHARHSPRIRHIFVPIDFSEASLGALDYALALAGPTGATITLLHVLEPGFVAGAMGSPPDTHGVDHSSDPQIMADRLHTFAQTKIPAPHLGGSLVSTGPAGPTIAEIARQRGADLIVVATHGYSGLTRAFLGSTAEYLVREGPCPVLAARRPVMTSGTHGNRPGREIKSILVPMDLSEPSLHSFAYAEGLARQLNADLTLLHVVPALTVPQGTPMEESQLNLHAAEGAEVKLQEIADHGDGQVSRTATKVVMGEAGEEITRVAGDLGSDLLVVATHGRGGLQRAVLGSTAENILRHAPCPVLVVRRPDTATTSWLTPPLFFPVAPFTP